MLMAAARCNLPTIFVSKPMLPGHDVEGRHCLTEVFEAVCAVERKMTEEEAEFLAQTPVSCGSCSMLQQIHELPD